MSDNMQSNGLVFDKATKFGERFGFPALITTILVLCLMYGLYFVLRYEVFYTREKVEAMNTQINSMMDQHSLILGKQEAAIELEAKQMQIQCGMCWNAAQGQEEFKRCNCTPISL